MTITAVLGLALGIVGAGIIIHTVPLYFWYAALGAFALLLILLLMSG